MATTQKTTKKKVKRSVHRGIVSIKASFNNTIISITDIHGNVLVQSSAGRMMRGARKSTPHAAQVAATSAATKAVDVYGMTTVDVVLKGPGVGRESAIRAIAGVFENVLTVTDATPIPHNGCRPRKRRRI